MTKNLFKRKTLAFAVAGFVAAAVAVTACKKDKKVIAVQVTMKEKHLQMG